jgi:hypothetical protein
MVPQFLPWAAQVVGVQPHTPAAPPPPQVSVPLQEPQEPLQPSPPQFLPPLQLGVQAAVPEGAGAATVCVALWALAFLMQARFFCLSSIFLHFFSWVTLMGRRPAAPGLRKSPRPHSGPGASGAHLSKVIFRD